MYTPQTIWFSFALDKFEIKMDVDLNENGSKYDNYYKIKAFINLFFFTIWYFYKIIKSIVKYNINTIDQNYISNIYNSVYLTKKNIYQVLNNNFIKIQILGSIKRQEGSNLSRCKPLLRYCTQEGVVCTSTRFDPSRCLIEHEFGSRLVY